MSVKHLTLKLILYTIYIMWNSKKKKKDKDDDKCLTQEDLDELGFDDTIDDLVDARNFAEEANREEEEEEECDEACETEKSLYQLYQDRLASLNCAQNLRTIERELGNNPVPITDNDIPDINFLKNIYQKLKYSIGGQTAVYSQFNKYQDQIDTILSDTRKQHKELSDEINLKDSNYEVNYRKSYYETLEIDKVLYGQNIVIIIYFILLVAYSLFMIFMKEKYKDFKFYIFVIVLFILPYYIIPILVGLFFNIKDYINLLMKTSGPKNTYMDL